eukprot:48436-Amphidinium_carterae.1
MVQEEPSPLACNPEQRRCPLGPVHAQTCWKWLEALEKYCSAKKNSLVLICVKHLWFLSATLEHQCQNRECPEAFKGCQAISSCERNVASASAPKSENHIKHATTFIHPIVMGT